MNIWDVELAKPQAAWPYLEVVRFVKRNPQLKMFLDIGSGGGANAAFLVEEDRKVLEVDISEAAFPDIQGDIQDLEVWHEIYDEGPFDCVLDHNTLCHVECPPFDKIHEALTPGGIFFMVAPTEDTCIRGELQRRSFTRFASEVEIRDMLKMFSQVWIGHSEYTDRKIGQQIKSYVVEATK